MAIYTKSDKPGIVFHYHSYIFPQQEEDENEPPLSGKVECSICRTEWLNGDKTIQHYIWWFCTEEDADKHAEDHVDFFHPPESIGKASPFRNGKAHIHVEKCVAPKANMITDLYQDKYYRNFYISPSVLWL